tara:strand:- start:114 stop:296 length:183 start_codon:yes stop_codon:yes gene_type:complete
VISIYVILYHASSDFGGYIDLDLTHCPIEAERLARDCAKERGYGFTIVERKIKAPEGAKE